MGVVIKTLRDMLLHQEHLLLLYLLLAKPPLLPFDTVNYAYMNLMLGLRFTAISIPNAPSFNLYNGNNILHGDGMLTEAASYLLLLDNFCVLSTTKFDH